MADTLNKPKLQLRTSFGINVGEKTPSPATKLLINHGKPNFTIQKSTTSTKENGNTTVSPTPDNNKNLPINNNNNNTEESHNTNNTNNTNIVNNNVNNNYYPYKTAATVNPVVPVTSTNGGNVAAVKAKFVEAKAEDNEATKVVLRKTPKLPELPLNEAEDENVPEFIRRQRRIQERLANQNILDFENRRSGYFTHVVISPTSANRTSFVETMASPAIVPALEIPPPASEGQKHTENGVAGHEEQNGHHHEEEAQANGHAHAHEEEKQSNGIVHQEEEHEEAHIHQARKIEIVTHEAEEEVVEEQEEEEEVAKAIEEVNKAVAGEDDDKANEEPEPAVGEDILVGIVAPKTLEFVEDDKPLMDVEDKPETGHVEVQTLESVHHEYHESNGHTEEHHEVIEKHHEVIETHHHVEETHRHVEETHHVVVTTSSEESITISHTNGAEAGPRIPTPDPSGALGVNFEPKTVVSFSKDLGSEPNKYPDTVVVVKEGESPAPLDPEMQGIANLKFDIKTDEHDIEITPVPKTE